MYVYSTYFVYIHVFDECLNMCVCLGSTVLYVDVSVCTHAAIDRLAADRGLTSATSLAFCIAVF